MAARRTSATDYENFEVGDQVRHPKWGVGSILFKSGSGESSKAIVVFPEHGQKKLLLKFAKLELIQDTPSADEDEFGLEEDSPPAPAEAKDEEAEEKDEEEDEEDFEDDEEELDEVVFDDDEKFKAGDDEEAN